MNVIRVVSLPEGAQVQFCFAEGDVDDEATMAAKRGAKLDKVSDDSLITTSLL